MCLEIEIFRHFYWDLASLEVVKGQYFLLSKFSGFLCSSELPSILLLCTTHKTTKLDKKNVVGKCGHCALQQHWGRRLLWLKTSLKFYSFQRRFSTVFHNYRKLQKFLFVLRRNSENPQIDGECQISGHLVPQCILSLNEPH